MTIRVAINGYGRIGRCVLRAIFESKKQNELQIVAINDLSAIDVTAHLTRYDTTHGRFPADVSIEGDMLIIDGHAIKIIAERNPANLPWKELNIDLVLECTGFFTEREKAMQHIAAGAKKVLISAPGKNVDATIVYGVNHQTLKPSDLIVSNASCTTNCLAPVVKPLNDALGIEYGLLNTVHAYTNDQMLLDGSHEDLRRARAAAQSIIPTKTGAAAAVGLVLPELAGKLDGFAMRVPVINVSVIDLTFTAKRETTAKEVNDIIRQAKSRILQINDDPLVSCDFNHNPASAIFDTTQTKVFGNLVKIVAWYDNEWGFSNRMIDTAQQMMSC
ncbi:type I glyceraldehyde-3-phosphate dehydrogenase [Legionella longbeachae]|uniref:Glyceraldehyde-3-phosphate dehydrogenase n=1 Tax=Legionella longbeachae serogroup 1 (strain NSW150) TaxID=661367 RepID=D3HMM6_LEGLN|nr:type I glyceraldehyde-3-phosphate dehydrogenase [Legionella longbeachae]VEE04227.1 glyceraldehyde 3-phosphate dehydrogenase [Legionella oakridgensis]HBD7396997.1 type I glyceraldehyde-3-phosphate dehydrogenase [Legionella pneumophila]ARB92945.1 type I glyceraldehyde-3-phosphate dehydrogenase [Legionella longbeachae]ARM33915.1 type I glyceraldehyde-3-phosphate dehydrogenase [Legionella longbeachae]EEZ96883.1 glyceraldehyde-3-phosphate dehydrogenase type I [Legionella longbeachae D-4968]